MTVLYGHRDHLLMSDHQRATSERPQLEVGHTAAAMRIRFERVRERAPEFRKSERVAEDRHRPARHVIEAPEFIEAKNVIGVRMRVEHGIHAADPVRERLRAKVRRRIHENLHTVSVVR